MRYGWKRKCVVEDPDSEHPEGWFFSYTCTKPLFPAAWIGHQEAASKSTPGGWAGGKRGRWGGCYCAWGSRKTPPCLCSRDQEADTSPGHSTQASSALRTIQGWKLLQGTSPGPGLLAAAESRLRIHPRLPNLRGAPPPWQKLNLAEPYLKGSGGNVLYR